MHSEFQEWLTDNFPTQHRISLWDSRAIGYPLGRFDSTQKPFRILAPAAYECDIYGADRVLDTAAIILKILSQLPKSAALISTFWQSLMLGDLGLYPDKNRLSNDLDVAIASPGNGVGIFNLILDTCSDQVVRRNRLPPFDMFSVSVTESLWREIPPTVQINYVSPYLKGEPVPYRPMLEVHPLAVNQCHAETLMQFLCCYAPFYIKSLGLNIVVVTSQDSGKTGHYDPVTDYPPAYAVSETIVNVFPKKPGKHNIVLSAHKEPTPRLAIIGPRIALAAIIGSIGKRDPISVDEQSQRLITESLRTLDQPQRERVSNKIKAVMVKAALVQDHLNRAARDLATRAYCHMRGPSNPFAEKGASLVNCTADYLRALGYQSLLTEI